MPQIQVSETRRIAITGINLNSANTDFQVDIPYLKYIARRVTVTNASVSLAASAAQLGLFTLANGGGIAVIPLTTLTAIDSTTKFVDVSLTFSNYAQLGRVFLRVGNAHGSAATIDVYIELDPLI